MKAGEAHLNRVTILLSVLFILLATSFLAVSVNGWNQVFDDSFISYRYSYNLAQGFGLVWNPGEAPTEGFTNILLVIVLVPFVKMGISPLLMTRIFSYVCVAAMAALIYKNSRQNWKGSQLSALLVSSILVFTPQTRVLSLVGLETVIYSLFLLLSFQEAEKMLKSPSIQSGTALGMLTLLSMWLRPEACLLYTAFFVLYVPSLLTSPKTKPLKPLLIATSILMVVGIFYLFWKKSYFGDILPNPFYIKASGSGFQPSGIQSIISFFEKNALVVVFFIATIIKFGKIPRFKDALRLGTLILALYILFFSRTETLMDIEGRFMYPMLPILVYLATPVLIRIFDRLLNIMSQSYVKSVAVYALLFIALNPPNAVNLFRDLQKMTAANEIDHSLMQKEFRVAKNLSQFPGMENVKMAFGDAGVIPYYTKAQWLDTVGLNNTFIARERDFAKLVDYFFNWNADIVIVPGSKNFQWFEHGHGPLGNYLSWMNDIRWDQYKYVGSSLTDGSYDLHFYLKNNSNPDLVDFIQSRVADGYYSESPIAYGTLKPSEAPRWTSTGVK